MFKGGGTQYKCFIPDTSFLQDHIWSHVELFSETLMKDDVHSLQSSPGDKTPRKASNVHDSQFTPNVVTVLKLSQSEHSSLLFHDLQIEVFLRHSKVISSIRF